MVLFTQIWEGRTDGTPPARAGIFLGPPGDVGFLPGGGLVYLERGLDHVAFGTTPLGRLTSDARKQRRLALIRNRIWRIDASGESLWRLPARMEPVDMAVAPDGSRLAVTDRSGLWTVDAFGRGRLLVAGRVRGPLAWSEGADAVTAVVDGKVSFVGMEGGSVPAWASPDNAGGGRPPERAQESEIDAAMLMVHQALNWWVRGHHAMHRGEYRGARDAYREAVRGFKDTSKGVCAAGSVAWKLPGLHRWDSKPDQVTTRSLKEAVCSERLLVVGDLISEFNAARSDESTAGLSGLLSWASAELEKRQSDASARARDLAQLRRLFQCPATDEPHMPEVGYFLPSECSTPAVPY